MKGRGRPLRFLGLVLTGWVGVRVVMLWPGEVAADVVAVAPVAMPVERKVGEPPIVMAVPVPAKSVKLARVPATLPVRSVMIPTGAGMPPVLSKVDPAPRQAVQGIASLPEETARLIPLLPLAVEPGARRWSGSTWFLARPGDGLGAAPGGQLGGSQAGVRLAWQLDRRIAAFGRLSAPLAAKGREAAVGLEWRPGKAPVRVAVEQRFGLDGTPGGTGLGAIAGVDVELGRGFRLESYGQTGVILRRRNDPYADGALRVTREVAAHGDVRLRVGGGVWGAAQRGVSRLDVGPSAVLIVPVAGRHVRVSLDWRQRIAGDARPGSGVALSLGSDF